MAEERYPQLLRAPDFRWWRPLLGLLLAGITLASAAVAVILGALLVGALTDASPDAFSEESLDPDTPLGLLANNLILAMLVPAAVLAVVVVHHQRPGVLASVLGRPRWGLLWRSAVLAGGVVVVFFAVGFLLPADGNAADQAAPSSTTLAALVAVILLTTPLQAAAEEVGFRGYLSQAVAAWFSRPVAGTLVAGAVSAVLFALAHGLQDAWLFGDRLAFGVVASWLAWRTGGLEAPVALHVANNLVSLVYNAATGSLESALTASTLPWQLAVLDVAMMISFAAVLHLLAGRWQVAVRREAGPAILSGSEAVGYPGPGPSTPRPAGNEHPWGMG